MSDEQSPENDKSSTLYAPQEESFTEMSRAWWDPKKFASHTLHLFNDVRVPWIERRLIEIGLTKPDVDKNTPLSDLSILDIGCGGGFLAEPLARLGGKVTGIDCNSDLIEVAKLHAKNENISTDTLEYLLSTIEEHAGENKNKYDVVVASEVVEHVSEQELFVKYCVECLRPGGSIFFTTNSKTWRSKFIFITMAENVLRVVARGTHKAEMFVDVRDLQAWLERENCQVTNIVGAFYDFIRRKWIEVRNPNILHYLMHAVKLE